MPSEPIVPTPADARPAESAPPVLAAPQPPLLGDPSLPPQLAKSPSSARTFLTFLLSLCFALFVADAVISLADDSLVNLFNSHALAGVRAVIFFFTIMVAFGVYGLMAITPLIPKRLFLPLTLFNPVALLLSLPSC